MVEEMQARRLNFSQGNLAGILRDISDTRNIFRDNFGALFVRKFVAQRKSFVSSCNLPPGAPSRLEPQIISGHLK